MAALEWTTEPPTKPGHYLRVNVGHRIQKHTCWEMDDKLFVDWGWDGGPGKPYVEVGNPKLEGWWWFHLPTPPPFESYPVTVAQEPAHA